jgi:hypothetical protein
LFWRQLRFAEFDVAEMSMSSLMIAKSKGDDRFVGIPVFTTRMFFHTRILVRKDAKIDKPSDLKGKRVGVPEYQQTAALWIRGAMQHEFGVEPKDMEFWMERPPSKSHGGATGFKAPPGVTVNQVPPDKSLGSMMVSGELDAVMFYLVDPNLIDRSTIDLHSHPDTKPLFPDPLAEGVRYYKKTGILPINHGMVGAHRALRILFRDRPATRGPAQGAANAADHPRRQGEPHGAGDDREVFAAAGPDQPADGARRVVRAQHAAAVVLGYSRVVRNDSLRRHCRA